MSGITLRQILMSINRYELVRLEDEFAMDAYWNEPYRMLEILSEEQLNTKFDYLRTDDGNLTIGINNDHYDLFKNLYEA